MKKILVFLSFISSSFIAVSQLDFSLNSLYSSSLSNFKKDSYSSGFGVKFGLSHIHMGSNNMGLETGFDWIISNNGKETTGLPLGIYTLSNSWYNWQFKLNGIFEYNVAAQARAAPPGSEQALPLCRCQLPLRPR